jgi:hypothetical protein
VSYKYLVNVGDVRRERLARKLSAPFELKIGELISKSMQRYRRR